MKTIDIEVRLTGGEKKIAYSLPVDDSVTIEQVLDNIKANSVISGIAAQ